MNTDTNGPRPARGTLSLNRQAKAQGPVVEERLQKVLAQAGVGSRRTIEERIQAGEIRVNGQIAEIGMNLRGGDRVEVDGKAFMAVPTPADDVQLLVYHKPEGELTTNEDPEGRKTVFERLPRLKGARWIAIGRLDMNTTGLLLLTTDGELAHAMMHPSRELEREYVVRVHGQVNEAHIEQLRSGVLLDDGPAHFDEIHVISMGENHSWFRVVLKEGRNREVRRLWEHIGMQVARLKRIRYGSIELPRDLRRGHFRVLPAELIETLRTECGLAKNPETLTLQAVLGVRRAQRSSNEYRPSKSSATGWSSDRHDEARELRAFDRVGADERPRGKRNGNKPGAGRRHAKSGGRRGVAPGQAVETASFMNYYPGQQQPGPGSRPQDGNRSGAPGTRRPGTKPGGRPGYQAGAKGAPKSGARLGKPSGRRKPAEFFGPMDSHLFTQPKDGPGGRGPR